MNKNYIIAALLLTILVIVIFNRNGQVELKSELRDYKERLKEIQHAEDSLKRLSVNQQRNNQELQNKLEEQRDSIKFYQKSKQQAIDYYQRKIHAMSNASTDELEDFLTTRYPE